MYVYICARIYIFFYINIWGSKIFRLDLLNYKYLYFKNVISKISKLTIRGEKK